MHNLNEINLALKKSESFGKDHLEINEMRSTTSGKIFYLLRIIALDKKLSLSSVGRIIIVQARSTFPTNQSKNNNKSLTKRNQSK